MFKWVFPLYSIKGKVSHLTRNVALTTPIVGDRREKGDNIYICNVIYESADS